MENTKYYVVTGANGNTGKLVANKLLEHKVNVRVILRNENNREHWEQLGAQVVIANLDDSSTLIKAFENASSIYLMNPPAYSDDLFERVEKISNAYIEAIKVTNPQKLVILSSVGAHLATGTGNIITTYIMDQKIAKLNIQKSFIRAAYFLENWANPIAALKNNPNQLSSFVIPIDLKLPMITNEDIAITSVNEMLDISSIELNKTKIIELEGETHISPIEIANILSKLTNTSIQAQPIPRELWPQILNKHNFSPSTIQAFIELNDGFNSGYITWEGGPNVISIRGTTSFESVLSKLLQIKTTH
eukprot:TRINITY_DN728_c1_g1_i1.p1 TRINITY_DN728_c1_g1~~TRINITY_DN728_c1_g1_i1.p1  ORF type:complete len:304 (+),score=137.83 TRINITY_DN728_c1_g1_i1:122-1033(+)